MNAREHRMCICVKVVSVPFADLKKLTVTKVVVLDRSLRLVITINAHCALALLGQVKMVGESTYLKGRAVQRILDRHYRKPIHLYICGITVNQQSKRARTDLMMSENSLFVESPKLNP